MAFTSATLHNTASMSGQRHWTYVTADTIGTVNSAGYFTGECHNMFQVNDYMVVISSTGGTPVVSHTYVTAVGSGTNDIVDGVAIANTDGS